MNIYNALIYKKLYGGGGGGEIEVESLTATENKTYNAGEGKAYNPVVVAIPEPTLISKNITANGNYSASADNADGYSSVSVNVPLPENAYLLQSIENVNIATFADGTDNFLKSLEVAIEPVQSGSGEPSPTNIRPILGWDEVNVTRCGKNLFDKTATDTNKGFISGKWINQTGNTFSYGDWSISEYIRVDGEKIAVSGMTVAEQVSSGRGGYCCYDKNKNVLGGGTYNALTQIITLPTNTEYIRISVWNQNKDVCQLELGETATAYEPYNGQTYTISLNGTRYGGKLDVVNGVLTVDRVNVTVDENSNVISGSGGLPFRIDLLTGAKASPSASALTGVKCNFLKEVTQSSSWGVDGTFSRVTTDAKIVYFKVNSEITTIQQLKTFLQSNNLQFVYELATPLTIQLTPTIIKSLQGENNFFADSGEVIKLQYWSKEVTS